MTTVAIACRRPRNSKSTQERPGASVFTSTGADYTESVLMLPIDSSAVLTAVARLAAEAASLDALVPRLATIVRDAIPFERMHVLRLDRANSVVLYVARADGELDVTGYRIGDIDRANSVVLYVARADGELDVTGYRIGDPGAGAEPSDSNAPSRIVCT